MEFVEWFFILFIVSFSLIGFNRPDTKQSLIVLKISNSSMRSPSDFVLQNQQVTMVLASIKLFQHIKLTFNFLFCFTLYLCLDLAPLNSLKLIYSNMFHNCYLLLSFDSRFLFVVPQFLLLLAVAAL